MTENQSNYTNNTIDIIYPVPAYIACGLNNEYELSELHILEILYRIRKFYNGKLVYLS